MVDIFSKREGPLLQDVAARRMLDANRAKITSIADRLTQGGYSKSRNAAAAARNAVPEERPRSFIYDQTSGSARSIEDTHPMVRVSLNNRVIVVDANSARQMHYLGEIRQQEGVRYFALATSENGFISPVDPDIAAPLAELDGQIIDRACPETLLAEEIAERLGYA